MDFFLSKKVNNRGLKGVWNKNVSKKTNKIKQMGAIIIKHLQRVYNN